MSHGIIGKFFLCKSQSLEKRAKSLMRQESPAFDISQWIYMTFHFDAS